MFLSLRYTVAALLTVLFAHQLENAAVADGPVGGSFRIVRDIRPAESMTFAVAASPGVLHLKLSGDGTSNLGLELYDEELGLVAFADGSRGDTVIQYFAADATRLRVVVVNQDKHANWFILSGY